MAGYVLALDQGTTSSRAIVFDHNGMIVAQASQEFPQYYPASGWVEHDPEEIWESQLATARQALAESSVPLAEIAAIGITNQRETTVLWDRTTGIAVHRAIVWQDRRTAPLCAELRAEGMDSYVQQQTGLLVDPYFSATKLHWLLEHVPGARERAERGDLAFGTIDSYLIWRLSGGRLHITDVSNASRTMLFNIHTLTWDQSLLHRLRIPHSVLPEIRSSSEVYGETETELFGKAVPLAGAAGDQQAATFGQMCWEEGLAKNTYGTGCFLLLNTGEQPTVSSHNLLTTVAWKRQEHIRYALEGSVFIGGSVVKWLRDGLRLIQHAADIEELASSVPDSGGVIFVPAFVGLGAPYWDSEARGLIAGLTQNSTPAHLARAALEAICFQSCDVARCMSADSGTPLLRLRVDGGASANSLLMQMQADLLGIPVERPLVRETTALGAAYLAGLAVGEWASPDELAGQRQVDRVFESQLSVDERESRYLSWRRAVERARG